MAKLTLTDLASLTNETSAITTINNNNDAIEQAMEKTLTRDGTSPNSLSAQLDMNTHKIINLDKGTATGEALEYSQLQEKVDDIELIYNQAVTAKNQAQAAQAAAELAESGAKAAEDEAEDILADIQIIYDQYNNQFLGTFTGDPTVDNKGNPLTVGDIYYNSVLLSMRVWDGTVWQDIAAMTPTSNNEISNKIYINPVFRGTFLPETDDGVALGSTTKEFSDLFLASGAVINFNSSDVTITHNAASGGRLDFAGGSGGYYFSSTIAPSANDGAPLGSASVSWSDLFLASGAVINFNNSNVLLTHTANSLALTGVGTNGFSIDGALKILGGYGTTNGSGNLAIGSTNTGTNNISIAWGDNSGKTLNLGYAAAGVFTPRYKFVDTGAFSPAVNDSAVLGTSALMWSDLFLASGAVINFNNSDYTLTHSTGILTASGDIRISSAGTNSASVVTVGGTQTLTNKSLTAPALGTPVSGDLRNCSSFTGDSGSGGIKGIVPAPAAGDTAAAKFLKADGTWAVPAGSGTTREVLTSNRTYYVRTDGSNSNNGLTNTSGGAFATIQYAMDIIAGLDTNTHNVTIQLGNTGTYTGCLLKAPVGAGTVIINGDTANPSNYTITKDGSSSYIFDGRSAVGNFQISGVHPHDSTVAYHIISGVAGNIINANNNDYGNIINYPLAAKNGGQLQISGANNKFSCSTTMTAPFLCDTNSNLIAQSGTTFTWLRNIAYSNFVLARWGGILNLANITCTLAGFTATGSRYNSDSNAIIIVGGGGSNFFPGSTAGSTSNGGLYS
jgi:hypothetical protein